MSMDFLPFKQAEKIDMLSKKILDMFEFAL
jgi:hypothetical protein